MIAAKLLLVTGLVFPGQLSSGEGAIVGTVVNASQGGSPVGNAEVVLRGDVDGRFVPLAETTADEKGQFLFTPLPTGEQYLYLPGANRDGVHYPGRRIRLTRDRPQVRVKLTVCDSITAPSPLVAKRHEFVLSPKQGSLSVTETILVDNPTTKCYIGLKAGDETEPVTLQLGVPSDFERTTFHKEFFGRRFSLVDGKLVTSVPWQPGTRELKFTYVVPIAAKYHCWERPLDLPCSDVRISVAADNPDEVSCNLATQRSVEGKRVVYASQGDPLPAGHVLRVELGQLPVPWITYGRWLSIAVLVLLMAATGIWTARRRRSAEDSTDGSSRTDRQTGAPVKTHNRRRKRRQKRKGSLRRAA